MINLKKNTFRNLAAFAAAIVCISTANAQDETTPTTTTTTTSTTSSSAATGDLKMGEFGIRYLPTFSSFDIKTYNGEVLKGTITMSHGIGINGALNFSKHIGIQAEINYYEAKQNLRDAALEREVKICKNRRCRFCLRSRS